MSNELIFILLVLTPLFIFGISMTIAQRKFLASYRQIVDPDKPTNIDEIFKNIINKPDELRKSLNDFNNYPHLVSKLYWMHYKNPTLEKEANLVRKFTMLAIILPTMGFIIAFSIALIR